MWINSFRGIHVDRSFVRELFLGHSLVPLVGVIRWIFLRVRWVILWVPLAGVINVGRYLWALLCPLMWVIC
jgi:hypothetical protein